MFNTVSVVASLVAGLLLCAPLMAAPSLSAQFDLQAKESEPNQKICDQELKDLPKADVATPADLVKTLKAIPRLPRETAFLFETLSNSSLPVDKADLHKSAEEIMKAPLCWDTNSLALQSKGAALMVAQGTKRQKEDFTAAYVVRARAENKKQQLMVPLVVALDVLEQLSKAELLNASVKAEIRQAHARAVELSQMLSTKYPETSDTKDDQTTLEIRRAELSAARQVQALLDSILKKI